MGVAGWWGGTADLCPGAAKTLAPPLIQMDALGHTPTPFLSVESC